MKAQKVIKGLDPLFNHGAKLGVGGQRHAPAALPPEKRPDIHGTGGDPTLKVVHIRRPSLNFSWT